MAAKPPPFARLTPRLDPRLPARMTNTDSFVVTPIEVLLFTLFSQSPERAGTHAGAWKQDVSPAPKGGCGGYSPRKARARASEPLHISHRLLGGVSRRRCPSHTTVICFDAAGLVSGIVNLYNHRRPVARFAGQSQGELHLFDEFAAGDFLGAEA